MGSHDGLIFEFITSISSASNCSTNFTYYTEILRASTACNAQQWSQNLFYIYNAATWVFGEPIKSCEITVLPFLIYFSYLHISIEPSTLLLPCTIHRAKYGL